MRKDWESPKRVAIRQPTRGERRRKSLRRGIDRWHLDTVSTCTVKRVMRIALTFSADDPMAARGAIRTFWQHYRAISDQPYFSWAELQRRGALHYHALIVNPPWKLQRQARRWLTDHWPHSAIQPHLEYGTAQWFRAAGGNYVKAYAKKEQGARAIAHSKAYQQDYDELPTEIRTYENSRTTWSINELDKHISRVVAEYVPESANHLTVQPAFLILWGIAEHTPPPGGCTLRQKKRTPHRSKYRSPLKGRRSVITTPALRVH